MEDVFCANICGVWVDPDGGAWVSEAVEGGGRRERKFADFKPFAWTVSDADFPNHTDLRKSDDARVYAPLDRQLWFDSVAQADKYMARRPKSLPFYRISSAENQFLTARNLHLFADMRFGDLRRMELDIEVFSEDGSFPNASRAGDRILAVGLSGWFGERIFEIESMSDEAECALLRSVAEFIVDVDPDVIAGHNIFNFDLSYMETRCKKLGLKMGWGRFGAGVAKFRKSRISIGERIIQYRRCDIPGRAVVDTLLLVQFYDISAREMESYTLKQSAVHFGISSADKRTYIAGGEIKNVFFEDRATFRKYLSDDLRETRGLCDLLLPTYVAQARNFPMTLQECVLRGSGMKVESIFVREYFKSGAALPLPSTGGGEMFEGAISEGFEIGLFKNVLHYDVASLYPSLMLVLGECPKNDYLKVFLQQLRKLREYRLKYKRLAREAADAADRAEFDARQKSFKILINSFYGYLGLPTAMFSDVGLAAKITAMGRELLTKLIAEFRRLGCVVLEADTDGIYVSGGGYFGKPEVLLSEVSGVLPEGVDLEFDGSYSAMLCYKAKNYALLDGGKPVLKGSAFRNRATEPFLRNLTRTMILDILLEREDEIPALIESTREKIISGKADISLLAKSEFITKSPESYKREVEASGKGRRAALEAALMLNPHPASGEKVSFYIAKIDGKRNPDWKCARPVELYDPEKSPYDAEYYLRKIDDWRGRFAELVGAGNAGKTAVQGELF